MTWLSACYLPLVELESLLQQDTCKWNACQPDDYKDAQQIDLFSDIIGGQIPSIQKYMFLAIT